jgi:glutamine amidotransferase
MKICIVDYGVGNVHNALKAFQLYATDCAMTDNAEELLSADAIVLPGVGAFEAGMQGLRDRTLIDAVKEVHAQEKPIMGICLGAQLLMSTSYEFGEHAGLNIIPGDVLRFQDIGERIPHIGWNEIEPAQEWDGSIFEGIGSNPEMYFVHSYYMKPSVAEHGLATTTYGDFSFTSVIRQNNVFGCQFHPEKSGKTGLKIIENFVRLME